MNHEMCIEFDHKRQLVKKRNVDVLLTFEFPVSFFVGTFQFDIFTIPTATEGQIVIPNHRRKPLVIYEKIEDLTALWSFGDKIANRYYAYVLMKPDLVH